MSAAGSPLERVKASIREANAAGFDSTRKEALERALSAVEEAERRDKERDEWEIRIAKAHGEAAEAADKAEARAAAAEQALRETYDLLRGGEADNALHALDAFLIRLVVAREAFNAGAQKLLEALPVTASLSAARLEEIRAEHERLHRPAGRLTMRREGCETCELLAFVRELQPDEDYHPRYQDEYQRLWHEAAAEVERLKGVADVS